ncbi:MAG TPA: TolC family protein [Paludibacteraceae bacterium]|nr:TolC family protein [Paludibacteraceae bacterium]HPH62134.1 TolC family protein [Paludibacteraceae bacterium]
MKKVVVVAFWLLVSLPVISENVLTLEECRVMALENNKEHKIAAEEVAMAGYKKKAAFTKYLPDLSIKGSYIRNEKDLSLIGEDMYLPIGTVTESGFAFTQDQVNNKWTKIQGRAVPLDANGMPFDPKDNPEKIMWKSYTTIPKDELTLDTKNIYMGVLNLTQPIFMGGKIVAYNKIANLSKDLAMSKQESSRQNVILSVDETYWQIVSLANKKKAVNGLMELLSKMNYDVSTLKESGLATKADQLSVQVKQNEAEMALLKIENGISLSKMLLAQYCGLPVDQVFSLADENLEEIPLSEIDSVDMEKVYENRSEIKSLNYATQIYKQKENLVRADMLPTVALMANYIGSNPNSLNGFENKFKFTWNVGVVVNIPLLHWGEQIHLLNAAKCETNIANFKLNDVEEKIKLQVNQCEFKQTEAKRKLDLAQKNLERADENLKYATIGFNEGVIPASNFLEAQTAWLTAKSDKIEAEIDAKMTEVYLQKAIGQLGK